MSFSFIQSRPPQRRETGVPELLAGCQHCEGHPTLRIFDYQHEYRKSLAECGCIHADQIRTRIDFRCPKCWAEYSFLTDWVGV